MYRLLLMLFLLPILPAYLFFRLLPSTGNLEGTFQGMGIKLSGAFAGYFALFLVIIHYLEPIRDVTIPQPSQLIQVWNVEGQLTDEQGNGIEPLSKEDVQFQPDVLLLQRGGWFKATFTTQANTTATKTEFPALFLSHPDYIGTRIDLGPDSGYVDSGNRDEATHHIFLKKVVLKRPAPYSPTGSPPAEAASGASAALGERDR
jgi:hypothetical protein